MFVTRFAPSPTGRLHRGHAYSALIAADAARRAEGVFILRIEDLDAGRCRPEFEVAIFEDLAWLGLHWPQPVRRQSEHTADYAAALEALRARGLLYRCFRTRAELASDLAGAPHGLVAAPAGGPLPLVEEDRRLAGGEPFAWRLSLQAAYEVLGGFEGLTVRILDAHGDIAERPARPETAGDIALSRKDAPAAYHLACVLDDALQGITHVIRGEDLAEAADIQRLLQALLGLPPVTYRHHPLIVGPDGKRLAKRDQAETLAAHRAAGLTPDALRRELGLPSPPGAIQAPLVSAEAMTHGPAKESPLAP
jgi:glutamyl-Q tRNA(Asp) synthetase